MFRRSSKNFKIIASFVLTSFIGSFISVDVLHVGIAEAAVSVVPMPTEMVSVSSHESLPMLKGLRFDPANPLNIEFVIDKAGNKKVSQEEASMLIRYFLTSLSVPGEDLWVNLSPYESNRVIDAELEATELGQELIAQDYLLKQLSSSLTHPDSEIGEEYWKQIQEGVGADTYNKIWISPDQIEIFEGSNSAYVTKATLQVMTEEDYNALQNNMQLNANGSDNVVRDLIVPQIAEDVNKGKNFASLRQVYNAIVLGAWFKKKFVNSLYSFYYDSDKVQGIDKADPNAKEKIYNMYVEAFQKGAYDFIKKEYDPTIGRKLKRRYFSGGVETNTEEIANNAVVHTDENQVPDTEQVVVQAGTTLWDSSRTRVVDLPAGWTLEDLVSDNRSLIAELEEKYENEIEDGFDAMFDEGRTFETKANSAIEGLPKSELKLQDNSYQYVDPWTSASEVHPTIKAEYSNPIFKYVMDKTPKLDSEKLVNVKASVNDKIMTVVDLLVSLFKFGTSGARGSLSKGFDARFVSKLAQGYANHLKKQDIGDKPVLIGYDRRHLSREFAFLTASILAAKGIKVELFETDESLPVLMTRMGKQNAEGNPYAGGIYITASHNPGDQNGFKPFGVTGALLDTVSTKSLAKEVDAVEEAKVMNIQEAIDKGLVELKSYKEEFIQNQVDIFLPHAQYLKNAVDMVKKNGKKIIIDPFHGAADGNIREILVRIFKEKGYDIAELETLIVERNTGIDRNFTGHGSKEADGVGRPNPDMMTFDADGNLVLATDGDGDRGGYIDLLNGEVIAPNALGPILAWVMYKKLGLVGGISKTIPSSDFAKIVVDLMRADYGKKHPELSAKELEDLFPYDETPTGYKFQGPLQQTGKYLMNYEESWHMGHILDPYGLDNGPSVGLAAMLAVGLAGKPLLEVQKEIEELSGKHAEANRVDIAFDTFNDDPAIAEKAQELLKIAKEGILFNIEKADKLVAGNIKNGKENIVLDYAENQLELDSIGHIRKLSQELEAELGVLKQVGFTIDPDTRDTDGYKLVFDSGTALVLRPSGTEPKIKIYGDLIVKAGDFEQTRVNAYYEVEKLLDRAQDIIGVRAEQKGKTSKPLYVTKAEKASSSITDKGDIITGRKPIAKTDSVFGPIDLDRYYDTGSKTGRSGLRWNGWKTEENGNIYELLDANIATVDSVSQALDILEMSPAGAIGNNAAAQILFKDVAKRPEIQELFAKASDDVKSKLELAGVVVGSSSMEAMNGGINLNEIVGKITPAEGSSAIMLPTELVSQVESLNFDIVAMDEIKSARALFAKYWK